MVLSQARSALSPYTTLFRSGRQEGAGTGLGIGNPRTRLHVGVERNGDGRQDADDRDDDHQLDEGKAALIAHRAASLVPEVEHMPLLRNVGLEYGGSRRRPDNQETSDEWRRARRGWADGRSR